jgi:hypothetical protein
MKIFIHYGQEVMTTRVYDAIREKQLKFLSKNHGKIIFYTLNSYKIQSFGNGQGVFNLYNLIMTT